MQRHRDKGRCVAVPMVLTAQETDENPPLAIGMLEARYGTNGDDAPCNGWNGHQSRDIG